MPYFGSSFAYESYEGVFDNIAIYKNIIFYQSAQITKYDKACVNLHNGNIKLYNYKK